MVLGCTWVIGEDANLSLEIDILVQIGVLIIMKRLHKSAQSYTRMLLCVCACVKCMLKLCMVIYEHALSL